jgi:hypothetical protein
MTKPKKKPKIYSVNNDYRIISDAYSLVLEHKNSEGNWDRKNRGYYPTLDSLLSALYENEVRENLDTLHRMEQIKEEILANMELITEAKRGEYE